MDVKYNKLAPADRVKADKQIIKRILGGGTQEEAALSVGASKRTAVSVWKEYAKATYGAELRPEAARALEEERRKAKKAERQRIVRSASDDVEVTDKDLEGVPIPDDFEDIEPQSFEERALFWKISASVGRDWGKLCEPDIKRRLLDGYDEIRKRKQAEEEQQRQEFREWLKQRQQTPFKYKVKSPSEETDDERSERLQRFREQLEQIRRKNEAWEQTQQKIREKQKRKTRKSVYTKQEQLELDRRSEMLFASMEQEPQERLEEDPQNSQVPPSPNETPQDS